MHLKKILAELYAKQAGPVQLNLSRIKRLAALLGHPERKLRAVHVAGSNGKGSTCAFLFSILREAGYKVGLYTSPHLRRFNERIRINDSFISDKDIVRLYRETKRHLAGNETFFEITTMMAFLYFAEKKCDAVIVEVGLGGRLDATNILTPLLSVITRIDLEHTDILGMTISRIAGEKGGIIKEGVPVATSARGAALAVIRKIAGKKHAPLKTSLPWKQGAQGIRIYGYKNLIPGLKGRHQAENAALAVTVAALLQKKHYFALPKKAIEGGLENARWPGRMEFISRNILVDCAHNAAGMLALEKELKRIRKKKIMVLGILKDKDVRGMMEVAGRNARLLILTTPDSERAAPPEMLALHTRKPCLIIPNPKEALEEARRMVKAGELIIITGSIYLVGNYINPLKSNQKL